MNDIMEFEYKVNVKALDPIPLTDSDYVNMVFDSLYLPTEAYSSILFASSTCFDGVSISYESKNPEVINNSGLINNSKIQTLSNIINTLSISSDSIYSIKFILS